MQPMHHFSRKSVLLFGGFCFVLSILLLVFLSSRFMQSKIKVWVCVCVCVCVSVCVWEREDEKERDKGGQFLSKFYQILFQKVHKAFFNMPLKCKERFQKRMFKDNAKNQKLKVDNCAKQNNKMTYFYSKKHQCRNWKTKIWINKKKFTDCNDELVMV